MSSSENEDTEMIEQPDSDEEEMQSDAEDEVQPDIDASATESDDDDDDEEVDDDEDVPEKKQKSSLSKGQIAKITAQVKSRHAKRQGKQLYIRFPEKLPAKQEEFNEMVKALSPLITEIHKPRQKHARFCLVDFDNTKNRDKVLKELSNNDKKIVVSLPKTDDDEFIKVLVQKKIKQAENRKAKNLLRKQSKKNLGQNKFTSTVVIWNVPKSASNAQIKELFPEAVDIQSKSSNVKAAHHNVVSITFASTNDATKAVKQKVQLGGQNLIIRFSKLGMKTENASETNGSSEEPKKKNKKPNKKPVQNDVVVKSANGSSEEPAKKKKKPNKQAIAEDTVEQSEEPAENKKKPNKKPLVKKAVKNSENGSAQKPQKKQNKGKNIKNAGKTSPKAKGSFEPKNQQKAQNEKPSKKKTKAKGKGPLAASG